MRSSEFINEGFIDTVKAGYEAFKAPVGLGSRLTQWAGSKLPGGPGAQATGKRETSQSVNNAKKAVMQFAGRIGKKITELTPDDIRNSQLVGTNSDKTWDEAVKALKLDPTQPFGTPTAPTAPPAAPLAGAPAVPLRPPLRGKQFGTFNDPTVPPLPAGVMPAVPPRPPLKKMTEDDATPAPAAPNPGNADKQLNALLLKYTQLVQKYAGTEHNQNTPVDLQHFVITSTKEQAKELLDSLVSNTALTDKIMAAYQLELKKIKLGNVQQYNQYIAALRTQAGLPPTPKPPPKPVVRARARVRPRALTETSLEENLRAKYTEFLRES